MVTSAIGRAQRGRVISTGSMEIDRKLGGGIPYGTLMLVEGESASGKSTLAQQLLWGALTSEEDAALYATEQTVQSFLRQMDSLALDVRDYFLLDHLIAAFKFSLSPRKSDNGGVAPLKPEKKERARKSDNGNLRAAEADGEKDYDCPLFRQLAPQLQEQSKAQDHLWEYLNTIPVEEVGVPDYHPRLTRNMRDIKYRNLIYPVGKGTFVHVLPDVKDSRDYYMAVEPSLNPSLIKLMEEVDKRLINFVDELKKAGDPEERTEILLRCLERICTVKGGRKGGPIQVTEKQMQGLRYLMVRDKEGVGTIEPLINDPYIEDISCSGVGPLFVEHKIFGGLKVGIKFETHEELDRYVIKLSERIGRPVTVREPIVDAVLPDGSRLNIVYGGDVSKRGSNFSIRKFSTTPMSSTNRLGSSRWNGIFCHGASGCEPVPTPGHD